MLSVWYIYSKKSKDVNLSAQDDLLQQELPIIALENYFPQDIVDKNLIEEDITFAPTVSMIETNKFFLNQINLKLEKM